MSRAHLPRAGVAVATTVVATMVVGTTVGGAAQLAPACNNRAMRWHTMCNVRARAILLMLASLDSCCHDYCANMETLRVWRLSRPRLAISAPSPARRGRDADLGFPARRDQRPRPAKKDRPTRK